MFLGFCLVVGGSMTPVRARAQRIMMLISLLWAIDAIALGSLFDIFIADFASENGNDHPNELVGTVESIRGCTALAVALVPPVCVMGLLLSNAYWEDALGAGLLFATNLLGILIGGLVLMACMDSDFRQELKRSHLGAANFALTGLLLIPPGTSFFQSSWPSKKRKHTRFSGKDH